MATELATAYVSILPSTRGMKGNLTRQMGGPAGAAGAVAGGRAGGAMAGGIMGSMRRMLPAVGPLLAGVGVAKFGSEVVGVAGQAQRTEASLSALYEAAGHGADEATRATSRMWDEFSSSSLGMKAFQGGAESLAYLGLNAEESVGVMGFLEDAILATGGSAQEMERVTLGLTNAMNRNKATNQELQQISGAGIPIYDMLASQLGVTTGEIEAMASQGEVSVDDLTTALQDGPGQWAPALREGADAVRGSLPVAWESAKQTVVNSISRSIMPAVESLAPMMVRIGDGIAAAVDFLPQAIATVSDFFSGFSTNAAATNTRLSEIWVQIRGTFQSAFDAISAIVSWGVSIVQGFWDRFGAHILSFIRTTWDNIQRVFSGALDVISGIFEIFAGVFTGDWSRAWEGVKQIVSGVWDIIVGLVAQAINVVSTVIGAVMAGISQLWSAIWNTIKTVASNVWDAITGFVRRKINEAQATIRGVMATIRAVWSAGWNAVSTLVSDTWNDVTGFVSDGVDDVVDFVRGLPGTIRGFFSDAGTWLLDAGRNIVQGLIDGVRDMVPDVGGAIDSVVSNITDRLPWSPAKKGPLSTHPPEKGGANIVSQMAAGMGAEIGTLSRMADSVASTALSDLAPTIPRVPVGANYRAAAGVGDIYVTLDGEVLAKVNRRHARRYEARNGV